MRPLVLAAFAASMLAAPLHAATLVQDDDWSIILFHQVGSPILDGITSDPFFTFTVVGHGLLRITDAVQAGDRFQLTINGILQAETSVPGIGPVLTEGDPAFNSGYFSRGVYHLAAGSYTVTGIATASPFEIGNAYIGLVSDTVPEPATWAMMLTGFVLAGTAMRRRQQIGIVLG